MNTSRAGAGACLTLLLMLVACGGGGSNPPPSPPSTYTIGGSVAGLNGTLVLQQSGANNLNVTANGAFTFAGNVAPNGAYAVTILTQPAGQNCTVGSGSGNANANVTSVAVTCVNLLNTIGGTVSGLAYGSVVLQNNAGNDLTVSANGAFTFATSIAGGSNYSVTVSGQPPGPDCVVTGGTGTANANVTTVAVVCTPDPTHFFMPFTAAQLNEPTQLHVVPSKAMARTPIQVATDWMMSVGYVMQLERDSNGKLRARRPTTLVYQAGNPARGGEHVFALDLTAGSSLAPRQLSNLSGDGTSVLTCERSLAYADLDDPASAFLVLARPTNANQCVNGTFQLQRIRLSDSPTTAPVSLGAVPIGSKQFLYRPDGTFAGMVVCDYTTNRLVMFHDDTFTTSTTLLNGCVNFHALRPDTASPLANLASDPGVAFLQVMMQNGGTELYRVDHTRAISAMLHNHASDPFQDATTDDQYLYFSKRTNVAPVDQVFYRVRLDGTAPAQLVYSYTIPPGDNGLRLIGQVDTRLVLMRSLTVDPVTSARSSDVRTVDKTGSASANVIATYDEELRWMYIHQDLLFVNVARQVSSNTPTVVSDSTVLTVDGTVVQPLIENSMFSGNAAGRMLQFREVVSGGATSTRVDAINVLAGPVLSPTLLTRSDGSAYSPSGSLLQSNTFGLSETIGAGRASGSILHHSVAFDIPRGFIETVDVPNRQVDVVRDF